MQNRAADKFKNINHRAVNYWKRVPAAGETSKMQRSLVPVTVIGTKYDEFNKNFEPLQKKILVGALRNLCHQQGADLVQGPGHVEPGLGIAYDWDYINENRID